MKPYEKKFIDAFGYEGLKIIAAYEDAFDVDYYDRYASWFGDLNLHEFSDRKEISYEQLCERYRKSLCLLGITSDQARDVCDEKLTAELAEHIRENIGRTVKTNIGEMTITDYRELAADIAGYDSYLEMYEAGLRLGSGYDPIPIMMPPVPFELTREMLVVDRDMDVDSDTGVITAYLETWFDVDKKFGTHTAERDNEFLNLYAEYSPNTDELKLTYQVSRGDNSKFFDYTPTENEAALIKKMLAEVIRKEYNQTPQEFVADIDDVSPTMGGLS